MTDQPTDVVLSSRLDDETLRSIASFDDALALINERFNGEIVEADKELGNGFALLKDKSLLIGVPFIVLNAMAYPSTKGTTRDTFWSLHLVTRRGDKLILNDGGTGIAAQMDELRTHQPSLFSVEKNEDDETRYVMQRPMIVKSGLRVSRYTHPEHGEAETYYLDTSVSS